MQITNNSNIPLTLAVWAVDDTYDYVNNPDYISVTTLLKPLKQIILGRRIDNNSIAHDVEDYVASALGSTIHAGIENAWCQRYKENLKTLGYPDSVIERVLINPEPEQLASVKHPIPIYIEQRYKKEFNGFTIGGKTDMVAEGMLQDNKSTSVYSYIFGSKDEDYIKQGSLYRWLRPDIITEDYIRINFIFTDWSKAEAKRNRDYPQHRLISRDLPLWSIKQTEQYIEHKLDLIKKFMSAPEDRIPDCTDEELWRSPPKYKYYSNPLKTDGRSTKNFDSAEEANKFLIQEKNGKGVVIMQPGEVKRCQYCYAATICNQRKRYFPDD